MIHLLVRLLHLVVAVENVGDDDAIQGHVRHDNQTSVGEQKVNRTFELDHEESLLHQLKKEGHEKETELNEHCSLRSYEITELVDALQRLL